MSLTNATDFIFGNVEPPIIPGFEIKPMAGEFLTATGRKRTWYVGRSQTHWKLAQACYGTFENNKARARVDSPERVLVFRKDCAQIAIPMCPQCGGYGYTETREKHPAMSGGEVETTGHTLCQCDSGKELVRRFIHTASKMRDNGRINQRQFEEMTRLDSVAVHAVRSRRMFVTAMSMERMTPGRGLPGNDFPATGNEGKEQTA